MRSPWATLVHVTYPPDDHIFRDVHIASVLDASDRASAELDVVDALLARALVTVT